MAQSGQRQCLHCQHFFHPHPRNRGRQKYCPEADCQKASKAASQAKWLAKPCNRDYFKGTHHVQRVQAWRSQHPGYARRKPMDQARQGHESNVYPEAGRASGTGAALQEVLMPQAIDLNREESLRGARALQDLLAQQDIVFVGFLSNLCGSALQEDIARLGQKWLRLGHQILCSGGVP